MRAAGHCAVTVLVAGLVAVGPRAQVPRAETPASSLTDILAAAGRYVAAYKKEFFGVVAVERYEQTVQGGVQMVGSAARGARRRAFEAEVAILALDDVGWVGFRDIVRVDGQRVSDRTDRLMKLLGEAGPDLMKQGRVLADEGSRFNLGSVIRTINHPVLAFIFIAPDRQDRTTFALDGTARVNGVATTVVRFSEQARPGTVQGAPGLHVQADGRYWIEPVTGRILRAELVLESGPTKATLTSRYGQAAGFAVLVPLSLEERFETALAEVTEGHARYSGFRRFSVETQEKRGGGRPLLR